MQQSLTYQTSFTKDSYLIFLDDTQIGKLYKKEWLGSPIETTINGHQFKFVSKGLFRPVISILDKDKKQNIGTVIIDNFFKISASATLCFSNNQCYRWTSKGLFSYDWKWLDLSNNQIVASSNEPLDIFRQKGTIRLTQQNNQQELFIALGIHLRDVVQRQGILIRILCFIVFALLLIKISS